MIFRSSGKNAGGSGDRDDGAGDENAQESFARRIANAKKARKSDAEYESDVSKAADVISLAN